MSVIEAIEYEPEEGFQDTPDLVLIDGEDLEGDSELDAEGSELRDSFGAYLHNIGKIALLNAEEEVELAKAIEAGVYANRLIEARGKGEIALNDATPEELRMIAQLGQEAKTRFFLANLRLVVSIAKKMGQRTQSMTLNDVVQEGNLGLVRAIEKFDYAKGFKFSTYATWWIRQAITRAKADKDREIRYPAHLEEELRTLEVARNKFRHENFDEPTSQELSNMTRFSVAAVEKLDDLTRNTRSLVSLDRPLDERGEATLGDTLARTSDEGAQEAVLAKMIREGLLEALSELTERERDIIILRYGLDGGEPKNLNEIGALYDLTRERIRQLQALAERKLLHNPVMRRYAQELGFSLSEQS